MAVATEPAGLRDAFSAYEELAGGTVEGLGLDSLIELRFTDGTRITLPGKAMLALSNYGQKLLYLKEGELSASVPPQPFSVIVLCVTIPAVHLDILIGYVRRRLRRFQLGLGRFYRKPFSGHGCMERVIQEKTRGVDLNPHIGELELSRLKTGNRLAELHPVLRVLNRLGKSLLGDTKGPCRHAQPTVIQDTQGNPESLPGLPKHILRRHLYIFKMNRARL